MPLDTPIHFFNIANTTVELVADSLKYIKLSSEFVLQNMPLEIESGDYHLFNSLDDESLLSACMAMQDVLMANADYA